MNKKFYKKVLLWGLGLWLIGYALGFVFFAFVPADRLGWYIMPIGIIITILVLRKKFKLLVFSQAWRLALIWTLVAIVFDYIFLVRLLKPADGYYKLDVYFYYLITFMLPLLFSYFSPKPAQSGQSELMAKS